MRVIAPVQHGLHDNFALNRWRNLYNSRHQCECLDVHKLAEVLELRSLGSSNACVGGVNAFDGLTGGRICIAVEVEALCGRRLCSELQSAFDFVLNSCLVLDQLTIHQCVLRAEHDRFDHVARSNFAVAQNINPEVQARSIRCAAKQVCVDACHKRCWRIVHQIWCCQERVDLFGFFGFCKVLRNRCEVTTAIQLVDPELQTCWIWCAIEIRDVEPCNVVDLLLSCHDVHPLHLIKFGCGRRLFVKKDAIIPSTATRHPSSP